MVKLKKLLGNSSHTLKANLWTQISGIIVMLTIPNFLSINDYAKVVYLTFLLSFIPLYDLGIISVYNRLIPGLVGKDIAKVNSIESALIRFLCLSSILFGGAVAILFFLKYQNGFHSSLIFIYTPFFLIISFLVVRLIVREDYKKYYHHIKIQAILKLLQIPSAYFFFISGWLVSLLIAQLILIVIFFKENIFKGNCHYAFIKDNVVEGLALSIKTFFWLQILNFPRTFSSLNYTDDKVAEYGLVNASYQVVVSFSLAIFIPVGIKTYKLFSSSESQAFSYLQKVTRQMLPFFILGSILLVIIMPSVIKILFPKYDIPINVIVGYFSTVVFFPIFLLQGIVYAVKKNNMFYIVSSLVALSLAYTLSLYVMPAHSSFFILISVFSLGHVFYLWKKYGFKYW